MDLNRSIKKAKRKQLVMFSCISMIIFLIMSILLVIAVDKVSTRNYHKVDKELFAYQTIASPNTQIDSQVISNSSIFGGEVVTNQSKNIDGYIVSWSSLRSKYSLFKQSIDYNELMPSWYHSSKNSYEYNRQTKQKVAKFYNPMIENYYEGVKNEMGDLQTMEDSVAEVAISFDQAYTYNEVKKMFPENVNIVWLYLFSEKRDESQGPSGMPVYGFQLNVDGKNRVVDAEADKDSFFLSFKTYASSTKNQEIATFIDDNQDKKLENINIWGVMVTGQVQHLVKLKEESFVRGSSIGVTVPMVPYITPEK